MEKREFTFYDLIEVIKKHWWVILISAIVVAAGFGVFAVRSYQPEYTASVTYYVNRSEVTGMEDVSKASASYSWAQKVVNSYIEILSTDTFAGMMNEQMKTEDADIYNKYTLSRYAIKSSITMSAHENSNLFTAKVKTKEADLSYAIAHTLETAASKYINDVTSDKDTISVVDKAELPTSPSNTNRMTRNAAIGFLLGALISYIIFFVIELLDVRVKNEEDLISNYDVPLLGTIPDYTSDMKSTRQGY
ncbi:MAG: hypothetical protein IJR90_01820 [Clostridia bacterium]|nr:hypothetical protein [Clostridia bacterium]